MMYMRKYDNYINKMNNRKGSTTHLLPSTTLTHLTDLANAAIASLVASTMSGTIPSQESDAWRLSISNFIAGVRRVEALVLVTSAAAATVSAE